MIILYRWVLRSLWRRLVLEATILALRLQIAFWKGWEWLKVHSPVQVFHGPMFEGVRVQVLNTGPLWFAFYISRDRTGAWWDRWPHISVFVDNG